MLESRPVQENRLWRNFVYDGSDIDPLDYWETGVVAYDLDEWSWLRGLENPRVPHRLGSRPRARCSVPLVVRRVYLRDFCVPCLSQ